MFVVAGVRLASIIWGLQLPVFALDGDNWPRGGIERLTPGIRSELERQRLFTSTLFAPMSHTILHKPAMLLLAAATFVACHSSGTSGSPAPAPAGGAAARAAAPANAPVGRHARVDRARRLDLPRARLPQLSRRRRQGPGERSGSHHGHISFRSTASTTTSCASSPNGVPADGDQGHVAQARDARARRTADAAHATIRSRRSRRSSGR